MIASIVKMHPAKSAPYLRKFKILLHRILIGVDSIDQLIKMGVVNPAQALALKHTLIEIGVEK